MPEDGFFFHPSSESSALDPHQYGSTWITEERMGRFLADRTPGASWRRLPRGLWSFQDLYLVVKETGLDLASLDFDPGPVGFLESCSVARDRITLSGWAVDRGRLDQPPTLQVQIGGEVVAEVVADVFRQDVVEALQGERTAETGWSVTLTPPSGAFDGEDLLLLKVVDGRGGEDVFHLGALRDTPVVLSLLRAQHALEAAFGRNLALEAEIERQNWDQHVLQQRLAAMEASFFWRLRNAWWGLKGRLGMGSAG